MTPDETSAKYPDLLQKQCGAILYLSAINLFMNVATVAAALFVALL